jgi:hypothetical protein
MINISQWLILKVKISKLTLYISYTEEKHKTIKDTKCH